MSRDEFRHHAEYIEAQSKTLRGLIVEEKFEEASRTAADIGNAALCVEIAATKKAMNILKEQLALLQGKDYK